MSIGPEPRRKSTYSLPLTSLTRPPYPSLMTTPPNKLPRLPPGMNCFALAIKARSLSLTLRSGNLVLLLGLGRGEALALLVLAQSLPREAIIANQCCVAEQIGLPYNGVGDRGTAT